MTEVPTGSEKAIHASRTWPAQSIAPDIEPPRGGLVLTEPARRQRDRESGPPTLVLSPRPSASSERAPTRRRLWRRKDAAPRVGCLLLQSMRLGNCPRFMEACACDRARDRLWTLPLAAVRIACHAWLVEEYWLDELKDASAGCPVCRTDCRSDGRLTSWRIPKVRGIAAPRDRASTASSDQAVPACI